MLCCHSLTQVVLPLFKLKHRPQPAIYLKKKNQKTIYYLPSASFSSTKPQHLFFVLKGYFKIF